MKHGVGALRGQLVQAVRCHDEDALKRLYAQVRVFQRKQPNKYDKLPERLRYHSQCESSSHCIKEEWEAHVDTCRENKRSPGPALWPMWSLTQPATTLSQPPNAEMSNIADTEWRALQRKYQRRKKQVAHFEKWYADFEDVNRAVVEQLNGVYRRLHAQVHPDADTIDATQCLPLDDIAEALVRLVPPAQPEAGGDHGE